MRRTALLLILAACAHAPQKVADPLGEGIALRNQGQIRLSIDALTAARAIVAR